MISYLSLGSNLSPRHHYIDEACRMIEDRVGHILSRSSDFYSPAWGYESVHEYLNIALKIETSFTPLELLDCTEQIERDLGRTIKNHYADRSIDIDILMCYSVDDEEIMLSSPRLILPHPRMSERDFVMVPLKEIFVKNQ